MVAQVLVFKAPGWSVYMCFPDKHSKNSVCFCSTITDLHVTSAAVNDLPAGAPEVKTQSYTTVWLEVQSNPSDSKNEHRHYLSSPGKENYKLFKEAGFTVKLFPDF